MHALASLFSLAVVLASCASAPVAPPRLSAPEQLLTGDPLNVGADGLRPGESVTLMSARRLNKWEQDAAGAWRQRSVDLYAWATFRADRRGRVDANAQPDSGSWPNADARGLLWSGFPAGAPELSGHVPDGVAAPATNTVAISLLRDNTVLATRTITLRGAVTGVRTTNVAEPGLNAVFALPPGPGHYPVVILLHGSEGGSQDAATAQAERFASRGFAALAINYFAWPHNALPGVATSHVNTPLEIMATARAWLTLQPEADVERLAVYGVSKGAEFAASAAARYPWIDAAVACVASDMVWEGYGREAAPGEMLSSWSWEGRPLPYVPLFAVDLARFPVNTQRYEQSLAQLNAGGLEAARIPAERSNAAFLLIGADRDEVWASGRMARALEHRLRARPNGSGAEAVVYPLAGHQICGDGAFPIRLYGFQSADPAAKSLAAEGVATVDAWERTLRFLRAQLGAQ